MIFILFYFKFYIYNFYFENLIYKWITEKWSYFLGNVLMGVRVVFLPNCPIVLFLLKHRGIWAFLN